MHQARISLRPLACIAALLASFVASATAVATTPSPPPADCHPIVPKRYVSWCAMGICRSGDPNPHIVHFDYSTGCISVGNDYDPAAPIAPNTPVTLKVTNINLFRRKGKISIQQKTFDNQTKPPQIIVDNLTSSGKASAKDQAAKEAAKEETSDKTKKIESKLVNLAAKSTTKKGQKNEKNLKNLKDTLVGMGIDPRSPEALAYLAAPPERTAETSATLAKAETSPEDTFLRDLDQFDTATNKLDAIEGLAVRLRNMALTTEKTDLVIAESKTLVKEVFDGAAGGEGIEQRQAAEKHGSRSSCSDSGRGKDVEPRQMSEKRACAVADVREAFERLQQDSRNSDIAGNEKLSKLFDSANDRNDNLLKSRADRDKNFDGAVSLYAAIQDGSFAEEISLPVASKGDDIEIQFDDSLTQEAGGSGDSNTSTILIIPVVGKRGPSFSTGIFFTGLNSSSYFKAEDGTAHRNEQDHFSPALGALVHTPLVFFHESSLSVPLSFGVALKDSNPVYVLGLSFIIGRSERSVLTVGLSGGQVVRLSGIQLGDKVTGDQPPTAKVFRTAPMIALSYNFPN